MGALLVQLGGFAAFHAAPLARFAIELRGLQKRECVGGIVTRACRVSGRFLQFSGRVRMQGE